GFFVQTTNATNFLVAIEAVKVSNQVAMQRTESNVAGLIRMEMTTNGETDEVVIANRPEATVAYETTYDAQKMMNPATNIFVSGTVNQSVASVNMNEVNAIPFTIQSSTSGNVTLRTTEMNGVSGYTLNLFNEQTGELLPYTGTETYTFSVTANQPYRLQLRVGSVTGIESFKANVFEVYPNPASDKVTIRTNGTGTLEVLNVVGQVVISQPASETNEINVSKLAKGVYTVKFNGNSQKLVVK
ncbi:MAG: T9SS type A sorting domain-containing protein, partial [Flexibacteraceae bacterium]